MQIAGYEVKALETGRFALDGGAMFGVVPKVVWEKKNPADELNRIALALRVLLLVGHGRVVLVDTGIGDKFSERHQAIYGIDPTAGTLLSALAEQGFASADVTDVVLTHLHFDHAGGATRRLPDGQLVPTFPNATYHVQRRNWDWAHNPSEKDRASYLSENFAPLAEAGQINWVEGSGAILPGVYAWLSEGHTVGQQLIQVRDEQQTLIYCADIIPTSTHLAVPYVMGYDLHPLTTIAEKKEILEQAAEGGWIVVFEHDPVMQACTVVRTEKGFAPAEPVTL